MRGRVELRMSLVSAPWQHCCGGGRKRVGLPDKVGSRRLMLTVSDGVDEATDLQPSPSPRLQDLSESVCCLAAQRPS